MLNSRDIDKLRPDVAANCQVLIALAKQAGYSVLVTGTVRDTEYQTLCYNQGNAGTKVPSFHSVKAGLAFDICQNIKGREYNDNAFWRAVNAIGKKIGFTWGGVWKSIVDKPHFQWDGHGKYTGEMVRNGNYPPAMPIYQEDEEVQTTKITANMNGRKTELTSIVHNGENYIRIRDLADAQKDDRLTVDWDDQNKEVIINSK